MRAVNLTEQNNYYNYNHYYRSSIIIPVLVDVAVLELKMLLESTKKSTKKNIY